MLNKVKNALRIASDVTIYDEELSGLISAAILDLKTVGVTAATDTSDDALIVRAVVTYCRLNFGDPDNYDKLKASYDEQKAQLKMTSGYTSWRDDE